MLSRITAECRGHFFVSLPTTLKLLNMVTVSSLKQHSFPVCKPPCKDGTESSLELCRRQIIFSNSEGFLYVTSRTSTVVRGRIPPGHLEDKTLLQEAAAFTTAESTESGFPSLPWMIVQQIGYRKIIQQTNLTKAAFVTTRGRSPCFGFGHSIL